MAPAEASAQVIWLEMGNPITCGDGEIGARTRCLRSI
jgi:hypothetical protein